MTERRDFFRYAAAGSMAAAMAGRAAAATSASNSPGMPADLDVGQRQQGFPAMYDVDRTVVNLDAAPCGATTREVHARYIVRLQWVNRCSSTFLRSAVDGMPRDPELDKSRAAVADLIGATQDKVALCGGGAEALYALIVNCRPLSAGDAVPCADVDHDEMQHAMEHAMEHLARSRGARLVRCALPEPHTRANLLEATTVRCAKRRGPSCCCC